jgi:hypothetical protein
VIWPSHRSNQPSHSARRRNMARRGEALATSRATRRSRGTSGSFWTRSKGTGCRPPDPDAHHQVAVQPPQSQDLRRGLNDRGVHLAFAELHDRLQRLIRRYRRHATIDQEPFHASLDLALDAISNARNDLGSPE